ncbi:MAG: hypothetical protein OHK0038_12550 [Flammeovirgaceae bacterium]
MSVVSFILFRELEDLERTTFKINNLYYLTLEAIKTGQDFFVYEASNTNFYENGRSVILDEHYQILQKVEKKLEELKNNKKTKKIASKEEIERLDSLIRSYKETYWSIVGKIKFKGFREYGLLGKMREYAHNLEEQKDINKEYLFAVRRYEKDYLLRNDTSYLYKMMAASNILRENIEQNKQISTERKDLYKEWINRHNMLFLKVVEIDLVIGYKEKSGLSMKLANEVQQLDKLVESINLRANQRHENIFETFQMVVVIIVTFSVILTLLLSMAFKFVLEDKALNE